MKPAELISPTALLRQFRALLPVLMAVYGLAFLALLVLVVVHLRTGIPIVFLTRDPTAAVEAPPYAGFYSNIGVLLWCAATSVCLFSAYLLAKSHGDREWISFLLSSGLLSGLLLLDDLFLLHETVLPKYLHIRQRFVLTAIAPKRRPAKTWGGSGPTTSRDRSPSIRQPCF